MALTHCWWRRECRFSPPDLEKWMLKHTYLHMHHTLGFLPPAVHYAFSKFSQCHVQCDAIPCCVEIHPVWSTDPLMKRWQEQNWFNVQAAVPAVFMHEVLDPLRHMCLCVCTSTKQIWEPTQWCHFNLVSCFPEGIHRGKSNNSVVKSP